MTWQDELARFARERGPALTGYARLLTGDLASAEDLVQEGIVRAWSRRRTGADIAWLEAYVRRAILNAYLDQYRRERKRRERIRLVPRDEHPTSPETTAVDRADIEAALGRLSPRERACTVLRYYDDLTVPEIAHRLGVSEGSVKRYLSDAARRLGVLLDVADDTDIEDISTNGGRR